MADGTRSAALKRFMQARGLKTYPWAQKAGVDEGTLRSFLAGKTRSMRHDTLERLAQAAGATVAELLGDRVQPTRASRDVVPVKRLNVRAALGGGAEVVEEGEIEPIYFRRDWLATVLAGRALQLRAIDLSGDSMRPTINDGDIGLCVIPPEFEPGKIYIIWNGHGLVAKRLEAIPGKRPRLRIISDNAAIAPPYEADAEDVHIIARLVWRGGTI